MGTCARSLFYGVILGVLPSLAIILGRKTELTALLCVVAVCVPCLVLMVPWVGLQFDCGNSHIFVWNGCQNLKLILKIQ